MDPFDDVLGESTINHARAGGKFQPKGKLRSRKEASGSIHSTMTTDTKEKAVMLPITSVAKAQLIQPVDIVDKELNNSADSSLASSVEELIKTNEDSFSGVPSFGDTTKPISVNPFSQVLTTSEDVGSLGVILSEVAVSEINSDWQLSCRQAGIEADSGGLDVGPSAAFFPEPKLISTGSDAAPSVHASHAVDHRLKDPFTSSLLAPEILGSKKRNNDSSITDDQRSFSLEGLSSEVSVIRKVMNSMDDLHSGNGIGDPHSNCEKLAKELDLDPFGDDILDLVTSKSRVGGKFQPNAKSHRKNNTSTSVPSAPSNATEGKSVRLTSTGLDTKEDAQPLVAENRLPNVNGMYATILETVGSKQPSKDSEGSFSDKRSLELFEASSQLTDGEDVRSKDALHAEFATSDITDGWHSCIGILSSEVDSMGFELEPFDDILSDAVTKNSNEDGEGSLCLSEVPALRAVNIKDAEENFGSRACDSVDFSACRTCDAAESCACPDPHLTQDTVTRREADVSNKDGNIQIDNGRSKIEEASVFPGMEGLDFMPEDNISSGLHAGKFRPKPKMKTRRERPSTDISHPEVVSTMHLQAPELVPSGDGFIDEGSVPALPADLAQDYSMRFDGFITLEPTSEIPMDEELRNVAETSHPDGPVLGDILHSEDVPEIPVEADVKARKGEDESDKSSRQLRKRVAFQLIDEPVIEANENGGFSAEPPPSNSNMDVDEDEDEEEDEEYRAESTSQNKKGPRKSKKPEAECGKPVRKRKKANEAADQSTQKPPKKFAHSTRRSRRRVDKALLETPEDDIDPQKLPIKDLILLAEYKERLASKEAATSKTSSTNLRSHKSFNEESSYTGEETFASEQGRGSDDDQPSYPLINYQSFMDKTPSTRWSKQDTELFYEAVRQLGTDFAMIQQLFPGRTRHQVKLKFKKEERQYPLRLSEALTSRAKDHSHFHMVIEQLQQASQAEQNSNIDDTAGVTGEEEVEEVTAQTKEEVVKPEQDEEEVVKDQEEVDFVEVHSPVKSDASEGDVYDWSQYKSDY